MVEGCAILSVINYYFYKGDSMTKLEVLNLLEENKNDRGISNWDEMEFPKCHYKSFGIGLTQLRKLAKKVGKNHDLAMELWDSEYYDAKVISILIDDPKLITLKQMEKQVKDIDFGFMVHVFSACGAPVTKLSSIDKIAAEWVESSDSIKRRCAYGFLYELSKSKKKSAPNDDYFLKHINHMDNIYASEDKSVYMSIGAALMGIGKRNAKLNQAAIKVAKTIGSIPVESGKTKCEPFNVLKHLTSDALIKKLGL